MIFYYMLKHIKNNVKLSLIFKGVFLVIILKVISSYFGFTTLGMLLEYVIMYGPLALIIIFQPEIRNILEQIPNSRHDNEYETEGLNHSSITVYYRL